MAKNLLSILLSTFPENWLEVQWFLPMHFYDYQWEYPIFLYFIPAVPLIFLLKTLFKQRFQLRVEVALSEEKLKTNPLSWLRFLPAILMGFFLVLILVAAARPQKTNELVEQTSEGIDILLVLDISESMQIEDLGIKTRLEYAKEVAINFIKGRRFDRIGVVIFSGEAYSLSPLTTDYQMLENYIQDIRQDLITQGGTAIGSALAVAINRMRESKAKTKVIILLSDGDNTAGNIDPITAAELAQVYGIKIYTIVVGKEGRVGVPDDFGIMQYFDNTIDETTLKQIADIGEGEFFRATNERALYEVFRKIDNYEKSEIKEKRFQTTNDFYYIYLIWALIFFLIWLFLKSTFITNVLED